MMQNSNIVPSFPRLQALLTQRGLCLEEALHDTRRCPHFRAMPANHQSLVPRGKAPSEKASRPGEVPFRGPGGFSERGRAFVVPSAVSYMSLYVAMKNSTSDSIALHPILSQSGTHYME